MRDYRRRAAGLVGVVALLTACVADAPPEPWVLFIALIFPEPSTPGERIRAPGNLMGYARISSRGLNGPSNN